MADRRVLITTFGFDETKALKAMRRLPYDRLVVILGEDARAGAGFARLVELEALAGKTVSSRTVDVFDFHTCFQAVVETLREYDVPPGRAVLNVSGGTKILADAAILAAFHAGVEAYHCGEELVKLPVLVGLRVADRFNRTQRAVLGTLRAGDTVSELSERATEHGEPAIRRAVSTLIRMGVLDPWLDEGRLHLRLAPGQQTLHDSLGGHDNAKEAPRVPATGGG